MSHNSEQYSAARNARGEQTKKRLPAAARYEARTVAGVGLKGAIGELSRGSALVGLSAARTDALREEIKSGDS